MRFHVNIAIFYTVVIKPYIAGGKYAKFCYGPREIWIAAQVPPERRLEEVRHEMSHAYDAHAGIPTTAEDRAQRNALMAAGIDHDLAAQGGVEALMALEAEAAPEPVFVPEVAPANDDGLPVLRYDDERGELAVSKERVIVADDQDGAAEASADRATCSCTQVITGGLIIPDKTEYIPRLKGSILWRRTVCPGCKFHIVWSEGVDYYGVPNGDIVNEPVYSRDPALMNQFNEDLKALRERRRAEARQREMAGA